MDWPQEAEDQIHTMKVVSSDRVAFFLCHDSMTHRAATPKLSDLSVRVFKVFSSKASASVPQVEQILIPQTCKHE